jgi:hypothetical protein
LALGQILRSKYRGYVAKMCWTPGREGNSKIKSQKGLFALLKCHIANGGRGNRGIRNEEDGMRKWGWMVIIAQQAGGTGVERSENEMGMVDD